MLCTAGIVKGNNRIARRLFILRDGVTLRLFYMHRSSAASISIILLLR